MRFDHVFEDVFSFVIIGQLADDGGMVGAVMVCDRVDNGLFRFRFDSSKEKGVAFLVR